MSTPVVRWIVRLIKSICRLKNQNILVFLKLGAIIRRKFSLSIKLVARIIFYCEEYKWLRQSLTCSYVKINSFLP